MTAMQSRTISYISLKADSSNGAVIGIWMDAARGGRVLGGARRTLQLLAQRGERGACALRHLSHERGLCVAEDRRGHSLRLEMVKESVLVSSTKKTEAPRS